MCICVCVCVCVCVGVCVCAHTCAWSYILLRGVENRRNIFFYVHYKVCFICLIIPRRRIKLGRRGAKRTFSNLAWFSRSLTGLKEEEKRKKDDDKTWNCKLTLSTIYPSQLALNSWSELWMTLSTTCSAPRVREGPFWFLTGKVTLVVAVLTLSRPHPSKSSVSIHPKCD